MLGPRLKKLRLEKKITQSQLAEKINVTNVSISGYESGNRSPDTDTLQSLADYFEVSTDYLLGRSNHPKLSEEKDKEFDEKTVELIKMVESLPKDLQEQFWRNAELMKKHFENK